MATLKRKAEKRIKAPKDKKDKLEHKNPHLENENHTIDVNTAILKLIEKFGIDYVVVTHFLDGTAIGVADKAVKKDKNGDESLKRVSRRIEDDYIWVGLKEPVSSGTVI